MAAAITNKLLPGWGDEERIKSWIEGARKREAQMTPINDELFAAADLQPGETVLDIGVGTGPSTIRAARSVGPTGRVVGADLSGAMLRSAQAAAAEEPFSAPIEWLVADAQTHDFGPGQFDAVISRFGVMFFPDPVAAFANLARAVRPGGRLVAIVWQTRDKVPLFGLPYDTATAVLDELGLSYTPVPIDDNQCSLGTEQAVRVALEPAGWRDVIAKPTTRKLYFGGHHASASKMAADALDTGPIRGVLAGRPEAVREQVRARLAAFFEPQFDGRGVLVDGGFMTVSARR